MLWKLRLLAGAFVFGLVACQTEPTNSTTQLEPIFDAGPTGVDEEFFGDLYKNGQRDTTSAYTMSLEPIGPITDGRLLAPKSFTQRLNFSPSAAHMYGWWDPAGAGSCGNLSQYAAGQRGVESHPLDSGQTSSSLEQHCIRPGSYTFSLAGKVFDVDYLQMAGSGLTIANSTASVNERVEALTYTSSQADNWVDHIVHVDLTPGGFSDTPVLDVENATTHPLQTSFANVGNPTGTEDDYFRFSVARSSSTWNRNLQGQMLARIYWDFNSNKAIRTGYYDAHSTANVIRHHQFRNHVLESRNAVVALETMRPDESPDDTVNVSTRTIAITRVRPVACATFESSTMWIMTDQILNAGCSTPGTNVQYRWQFENGGSWTSYSTSPLYSFAGHSSAGSKVVRLEVVNTITGAADTISYPVTVVSSQILLNGRALVTDKDTNLYSSNTASWWYERWNPDTVWYPATSEARTSMHRIWYAGSYTVSLRQGDTSPFRRGRLEITVCNPCEDPAPPARNASTASMETGWEFFGGGPWLSWSGNSLRLYDLKGMHDVTSRFSNRAWLDDSSGQGSTGGAGNLLTWHRIPMSDSNVRRLDFSIGASGSPFTFGFAVDPDLGPNAADDRTGYDAARGMVYVQDGDRAIGYLLRDSRGASALQGVTQYGLLRHSPSTSDEIGAAQRGTGIDLLAGPSDVQLLLSAPTRAGPVTWTLIMVRGVSPQELRTRADSALAELSSR